MFTVNDAIFERLRVGGESEQVSAIRELSAVASDPDVSSRDYELLATRVATLPVENIMSVTNRLAEDSTETDQVRVFAAVTCATACRRMRVQSGGRHVIRSVQHLEQTYPILRHMRALTYLDGPPSELHDGLALAESAYAAMPENPGVAHALACFLVDSSRLDGMEPEDNPRLTRALGLVNDALRSEVRPSFFYTRAKIHRKLGNFQEAKADLVTAIENEDRQSVDHVERIMGYVVESSLVDVNRTTSELLRRAQDAVTETRNKVAEIETDTAAALERIREAQARTVETIAFFAGALALIQFTAITMGKGYDVGEAVVLILVLGVVLFGAILSGAYLLRKGIK
jgi:hypothetical protein